MEEINKEIQENENLITAEGKRELEKELKNLIDVESPKVIQEIQEARAQGDLSENAEYHAAKDKQAEIEGRISQIQTILETSKVSSSRSKNVCNIGRVVTFVNMKTKKEMTVTLAGTNEVDPMENKISLISPIGAALFNHSVGEEVFVRATEGVKDEYKIQIKKIA